MDNERKRIALFIAAYNRQRELDRALDSLRDELHLVDIVIVDDCSNPPLNIDKFKGFPIHLIRSDRNLGVMGASNLALKYIYDKGYEFIAVLDHDDTVINQRIQKQYEFLLNNPDIGVVGGQYHAFSADGTHLYDSSFLTSDMQIRKAVRVSLMLHHPTVMIRTEACKKIGFYNEQFTASGDYEFLWRLIHSTKVANLNDFVINYEVGSQQSISMQKRRVQKREALKIKMKYFDFKNPYSYIGIIASIMDITNTLRFTNVIRKKILTHLFTN